MSGRCCSRSRRANAPPSSCSTCTATAPRRPRGSWASGPRPCEPSPHRAEPCSEPQEARMSELREVFEMTTKQMEPDVDSWRQQEDRQRKANPQQEGRCVRCGGGDRARGGRVRARNAGRTEHDNACRRASGGGRGSGGGRHGLRRGVRCFRCGSGDRIPGRRRRPLGIGGGNPETPIAALPARGPGLQADAHLVRWIGQHCIRHRRRLHVRFPRHPLRRDRTGSVQRQFLRPHRS